MSEETSGSNESAVEQAISGLQVVEHSLEALCTPYRYVVRYTRESIDALFALFWAQMQPHLYEHLMALAVRNGKVRPKSIPKDHKNLTPELAYRVAGGKAAFYSQLLQRVLERSFRHTIAPLEPLYMTDFSVVEEPQGYTIGCMMYFVPKVVFPADFKVDLSSVGPVVSEAIQQEAERRLEALRKKNLILSQKDGSLEEDDVAWLTVTAKIDGEPWPAGTITENKLLVRDIHPDAFRHALIGLGVGQHNLIFPLSEGFGALAGKTVQAHVRIHGVLRATLPVADDTFAVQMGSASLQALQDGLRAQAKKHLQDTRSARLSGETVTQLLKNGKFDAVPEPWLRQKAEEMMQRLYGQCKGNKAHARNLAGVTTDEQLFDRFRSQAMQEAWQVAALLAYGQRIGVTRQVGETLGNLSGYLQRVFHAIMEGEQHGDKAEIGTSATS